MTFCFSYLCFVEDYTHMIKAQYQRNFPTIGILGPRQCGKTTLAKSLMGKSKNSIYVDLEDPDDRAKLTAPGLFFDENKGRVICLDEVQFMPDIFRVLRGVNDREKRNGKFIILGSASPEVLRQSS